MFDVSFTELMIIGVIALIVIGPERLPRVARTVGHLLGRAQRYVSDVKSDIRREIELDELRKFKEQMQEAADSVQTSLRETGSSLRETGESLRAPLDDLSRTLRDPLTGPAKDVDKAGGPDAARDTTKDTTDPLDFPELTTPPEESQAQPAQADVPAAAKPDASPPAGTTADMPAEPPATPSAPRKPS